MFARACHEEGVKALFCCPGNYEVVHAIADTGIPTYGGRHEGSMCHAADAFGRATGEVAATSGTEGPGFTNMINAIATANAARSPILVLASNKSVFAEDSEQGIQDSYQQPTTEGLRKYGKRMITPSRVWEYAGYAFRQLKSGVPPDFTDAVWHYGASDGEIFLVIRDGVTADMQAFDGQIPEEDMWHLVNYIKSLAGG